jgi:hypothetical protein
MSRARFQGRSHPSAIFMEPVLAEHAIKLDVDCPAGTVLRTEMRPRTFIALPTNVHDALRRTQKGPS